MATRYVTLSDNNTVEPILPVLPPLELAQGSSWDRAAATRCCRQVEAWVRCLHVKLDKVAAWEDATEALGRAVGVLREARQTAIKLQQQLAGLLQLRDLTTDALHGSVAISIENSGLQDPEAVWRVEAAIRNAEMGVVYQHLSSALLPDVQRQVNAHPDHDAIVDAIKRNAEAQAYQVEKLRAGHFLA